MTEHEGPYSLSLDTKMKAAGVNDRMQDYILQCVAFHSFPAPGVLIAAFMVDYALELLGAVQGSVFMLYVKHQNVPPMLSR